MPGFLPLKISMTAKVRLSRSGLPHQKWRMRRSWPKAGPMAEAKASEPAAPAVPARKRLRFRFIRLVLPCCSHSIRRWHQPGRFDAPEGVAVELELLVGSNLEWCGAAAGLKRAL